MAMSSGIVSTFFSGETVSFPKSAMPFSSLRHLPLPPPPPPPHHHHPSLRLLRTVTSAAASKQSAAASKPSAAATGKREPRGIMKPRLISPEMRDFLGVSEIPRTQALKQIWAYIKQHNLQDPENKKIIVCDEKLKSIFAGRDRVGFLEIAGLINPHFLK